MDGICEWFTLFQSKRMLTDVMYSENENKAYDADA